jgi:hypothetical protein
MPAGVWVGRPGLCRLWVPVLFLADWALRNAAGHRVP